MLHYDVFGKLSAYPLSDSIIYHDFQICPGYSDATPLIEEAQKLGIPVQVPGILKFPYHLRSPYDYLQSTSYLPFPAWVITYVDFSSEPPESNFNFCPEDSRIMHPYIRHGMPRVMKFDYMGSFVCPDGYDIILDDAYWGVGPVYVQDPATCKTYKLPSGWIEHYKVQCKGRPRPAYFVHPEPTNIHPASFRGPQDCCCRICFDYSFTKGLPAGWVVVGDYSITEYGLLCRSAYCLVFPAEYGNGVEGEREGNILEEEVSDILYENGSFTIPPAPCVGAKFRGPGFLALSDDVVGGVVSGGPGTGAHFFVGELNDLINYGPARAYRAYTVIEPVSDTHHNPPENITYTNNFYHVSFCKVNPTTGFIRKFHDDPRLTLKSFRRTISLSYLYGFAPLGYRLLSYKYDNYANSDVPLSITGGSATIVANYDFDEVPLRYFYLYGGSHLTEVGYCTNVPNEEAVSRVPIESVLLLKLKIPSGEQIVAGPPSSMTWRAIDITLPNIPRALFDLFPPDSVTVPTFVHRIDFGYSSYGFYDPAEFNIIAFIPGAIAEEEPAEEKSEEEQPSEEGETDLLWLPVLIRNGGVNYANHSTVLMYPFLDSWGYQRLCDSQYRQIFAPPASPVVIANLWKTSQIVTIDTRYYDLPVWEEFIFCYALIETCTWRCVKDGSNYYWLRLDTESLCDECYEPTRPCGPSIENSLIVTRCDGQTYCATPGPALVNSPTARSYVNFNGQIIGPAGDLGYCNSWGII